MEQTEVAARGDHSIAELRTMLTGETPAAGAGDANHETPAAAGAGETDDATRTAPDSDPEDGQQEQEQKTEARERGEDGKFKAKTDGDNVQKRIDKAVKAQREAERERDELRARLANPGSQPAKEQAQPAAKQEPAATAKRPEAKDFETYDGYIEALQEWKLDQRDAQREQQRQQAERQQAERAIAEAHGGRVAKAREAHADYDEVLAGVSNLRISEQLHNAIVTSEHGPEIAYTLAKDPAEAKRIASLAPARQLVEFAKLELKLETPATDNKQPAKALPKPAAKVGGGTSAKQPNLNDPDISIGTFKRLASAALRGTAN